MSAADARLTAIIDAIVDAAPQRRPARRPLPDAAQEARRPWGADVLDFIYGPAAELAGDDGADDVRRHRPDDRGPAGPDDD